MECTAADAAERKAVVSAEMQYFQALQTLNSLIQASITPANTSA